MSDVIMVICGIVFLILFTFLLFIFTVFLISRFKKEPFTEIFQPELSIVIPVYNEEEHIKKCLDSIQETDYPKSKYEIILVDDGSTDRTKEIIKCYENVKLLKQNHLGKVEALNLGIKNSSHDFVITVQPFSDKTVGAATGNSKVINKDTMLGSFQNIEYHFNNMIRHSFSTVFRNGIWFFGALACYRKNALEEVGLFKKDTMSEDIDISLELKRKGYRIINVASAGGSTFVPKTLKELYSQRSRWWTGVLQALFKNKNMFSLKACPSVTFLFVNHMWWTFYAFLSFPIIGYQVNYWLPYNSDSFVNLFSYLFRWFSFSGPLYVIYKIPEWGLSFYSFFGVLSGLISTAMILSAMKIFKDKLTLKNMVAIFFYFPYTIILNTFIIISVLTFKFRKDLHFIS